LSTRPRPDEPHVPRDLRHARASSDPREASGARESRASSTASSAAGEISPLEQFHREIQNCMKCPLGATRTRFVFGSGSQTAGIMLIGEAPGFHEDQQGVPFVGAAGNLLNKVLAQVGLVREEIYIANVLKCRPPNNRTPLRSEVESCKPYLMRQIELINPRVIGTMGNPATEMFIPNFKGITKSRGKPLTWERWTIMPIYHPAAALYRNELLTDLVEDFRKLKSLTSAPAREARARFEQPSLF
jgi:DNA polymerase